MKIGKFHGTTDELKTLLINNKLSVEAYFPQKSKNIWVVYLLAVLILFVFLKYIFL